MGGVYVRNMPKLETQLHYENTGHVYVATEQKTGFSFGDSRYSNSIHADLQMSLWLRSADCGSRLLLLCN